MATLASILNRAAPLGILAVAVALLMIAGEFDLSIGSILGFSGMAIMIARHTGRTRAASAGRSARRWPSRSCWRRLTGFINGLARDLTKLPSFIITLGTLFIFRGLTTAITRSLTTRTQLEQPRRGARFRPRRHTLRHEEFEILGATGSPSRSSGGSLLTAVATWVLLRTRTGNWIFGTGGRGGCGPRRRRPGQPREDRALRHDGLGSVPRRAHQVVQFNGADALRGDGREFEAIIAAVVGGCLLTGGYGSAVGAALGALIFAMVQQGIVITGWTATGTRSSRDVLWSRSSSTTSSGGRRPAR